MSDQDTFSLLVQEFAKMLLPLREAISSREQFMTFMMRLGWSANSIPPPIKQLGSGLDSLITALEKVQGGDVSLAAVDSLRQTVVDVFQAVQDLHKAADSQFPAQLLADNFKAEFPLQLVTFLLVDYLTTYHPTAAFALRALGIIQIQYQAPTGQRLPFMRYSIQPGNIAQALDDPSVVFRNAYGWGTDEFDYETLFEQLDSLLVYLGVAVFRAALDEDIAHLLEEGIEVPGDPQRSTLKAIFFERIRNNGNRLAAELDLLPLPGNATLKPGLALLPFFNGILGFQMQLGEDIAVKIDGDFDAAGGVGLILRPGKDMAILLGFDGAAQPSKAEGKLMVRADYANVNRVPIVLLGSADGSRLEVQSVSGLGGLRLSTSKNSGELFTELDLQGARLVIQLDQGDSFLQSILPAQGLDASLELTVGLSSQQGFYFRGSGSLDIELPAHISLGFIDIQSLTIQMTPKAGVIPVSLGANIKAELGPLTAVIQNMGLTARFSFPEDNSGNLGPLDLDLGFKPPDGVGLSIDGSGFSGGGFLRYTEADQSYAGMLELVYQDRISLKAIGLLTTHLPGGEAGYSLLILITSEFTPIELGLGFTLNGVGGLIGLNRSAAVEHLRSGLRDGTLNTLLFPQDVIANAPRLLSDLRQVFPPTPDRFLFGPMARLAWGTPPLLTLDLGLILELPNPVRLLILGVLRLALPTDEDVLLQLQVNFLGVIDFNAGTLAFDATLFDSHLLGLTLAGDLAVRAQWRGEKTLLLSVGGFHPSFQPPPLNLPTLRRLTIPLLPGDNPRLTLETYFAVTSNTLQFGASVELYAGAGSFAVSGHLRFDALFQRSPFYVTATFDAQLDLLAGSSRIAGIRLTLTLEGPTPWHAHGTAHLEICWFLEISVHFDLTWGERRETRLDPVAVLPLLQASLSDQGNWQATLPAGKNLLVSFTHPEPAPGLLLIAPAGILTLTQPVVPLDVDIQTLGAQPPADATRFSIQQVTAGQAGHPQTLGTSPVTADFAPAQFFARSDTEKLTGKSFEPYPAGVRIDASQALQADYAARRVVSDQVFYKDVLRPQPRPGGRLQLDLQAFEAYAVGGAVAQSPLSQARQAPPAGGPAPVALRQEAYVVVRRMDMSPIQNGQVFHSEAEALDQFGQLLREQPGLEGEIQVLPAYEVNQTG